MSSYTGPSNDLITDADRLSPQQQARQLVGDVPSSQSPAELSVRSQRASFRLAHAAGVLVLSMGICIGIGVALQLYHLLRDPERVALLQMVAQTSPEDAAVTLPAGRVTLGTGTWQIVGCVLVAVTLLIAAILAGTFMRVGAALLHADVRPLLEHVLSELSQIHHTGVGHRTSEHPPKDRG